MRYLLLTIMLVGSGSHLIAAESPLVEKYLHTGELAKGEQVLELALAKATDDDQLRFSLGLLQVVRGIESLGQSTYEFGIVDNDVSFLRLPVGRNPDPVQVTYAGYRRMLDQFRDDLARAEATLAAISDEEVKLSLRLADIHLDFNGDRTAESSLGDILKKLGGPRFRFPADNPEFHVTLDRGDVAWLRAYCHLLMSMVELQGALDGEKSFDLTLSKFFANPKVKYKRQDPDDYRELDELWKVLVINDPVRLGRARRHLLAVCELNHESWRFIRAERDDDHEWLPNSKQKGVIGLPVTDEMVNGWLGMIDEFKGMLNGKKRFGPALLMFVTGKTDGRGFSFREFLDNPPDKIEWEKVQKEGINPKYLTHDGTDVDISKFLRVGQIFNNSLAVGYAMWFN